MAERGEIAVALRGELLEVHRPRGVDREDDLGVDRLAGARVFLTLRRGFSGAGEECEADEARPDGHGISRSPPLLVGQPAAPGKAASVPLRHL